MLAEETAYVLERQKQEKFIGNALDKPQILMKKTMVRETEFAKEELKKE